MKGLARLKENKGASLVIALLLFLVCSIVGVIVLSVATANSGRIIGYKETHQTYLTSRSLAKMISDELKDGQITYHQEIVTVYLYDKDKSDDNNKGAIKVPTRYEQYWTGDFGQGDENGAHMGEHQFVEAVDRALTAYEIRWAVWNLHEQNSFNENRNVSFDITAPAMEGMADYKLKGTCEFSGDTASSKAKLKYVIGVDAEGSTGTDIKMNSDAYNMEIEAPAIVSRTDDTVYEVGKLQEIEIVTETRIKTTTVKFGQPVIKLVE